MLTSIHSVVAKAEAKAILPAPKVQAPKAQDSLTKTAYEADREDKGDARRARRDVEALLAKDLARKFSKGEKHEPDARVLGMLAAEKESRLVKQAKKAA